MAGMKPYMITYIFVLYCFSKKLHINVKSWIKYIKVLLETSPIFDLHTQQILDSFIFHDYIVIMSYIYMHTKLKQQRIIIFLSIYNINTQYNM